MFNIKHKIYVLILLFSIHLISWADNNQHELELDSLLHQLSANNPDVLKARQSLIQTEEQIRIIQTALNPMISASASYSRVGPASKFELPGIGKSQLTPNDNYNAGISYQQTVYDFGKTAANVAIETERKKLLNASINELRQQLSIELINTYYQIIYLQNALLLNDEETANIQEHKETVQKKLNAGTSTRYALLSTEVRLSKLKNERADLEAIRNKELAVLTTLTGLQFSADDHFSSKLQSFPASTDTASLLQQAFDKRNSLQIAKEQEVLSDLRAQAIQAENRPNINAMASAGAKNGYKPNIDKFRPNFQIGVGIHVPIYSSSTNKHQLELEKARLTELKYATESEKRRVTEEIVRATEDIKTAKEKINREELQVKQADEAYQLALVSFNSGAITNLDLLDASTNLQDSKLQLLKTKIDYLLAGYALKRASGEILYE